MGSSNFNKGDQVLQTRTGWLGEIKESRPEDDNSRPNQVLVQYGPPHNLTEWADPNTLQIIEETES